MRPRRPAWMIWGGLGLLLFMAAYGLVALEMRQKGVRGPARRSTYSADSAGYKALYLWLRALGAPVERWEKELQELPRDATVLMVAQPKIGLGKVEVESLKQWVRKGGTLVLLVKPPNSLLEAFDLEAKAGDMDGGKVTITQPGPYTRGVGSIHSKIHMGLKSKRPDAITHLRGAGGAGLLTVLQEAKGRVIALADPDLFSNKALREGGHARLAMNLLLYHLGEGRLLVDEYHQGYGRASSVFAHLGKSRLAAPLFQGAVLLLLFWCARGRRFGSPRPIVEEERRSTMEYVHAMAGLLRRTGARQIALEAMVRWVEEEARRVLIDTDRSLQSALRAARGRLRGHALNDRQLTMTVRGLYRALEGARRRAPGI